MKIHNLQMLTLSLLILGVSACGGSSKTNPKLPPPAVTPPPAKVDSKSQDEEASDAKAESAAEEAASIRRTIAVKKDQLVRLQGRLTTKETLRNSIESRKVNAQTAQAGAVPGQISASGGGGKSPEAAVAGAVINIYAQKKENEKNAATQNANFGNVVTQIDAELKAANDVIDDIAKKIDALDAEIAELTIKLNGLAGAE